MGEHERGLGERGTTSYAGESWTAGIAQWSKDQVNADFKRRAWNKWISQISCKSYKYPPGIAVYAIFPNFNESCFSFWPLQKMSKARDLFIENKQETKLAKIWKVREAPRMPQEASEMRCSARYRETSTSLWIDKSCILGLRLEQLCIPCFNVNVTRRPSSTPSHCPKNILERLWLEYQALERKVF